MSPGRDDYDDEEYEDAPRSIFGATWFRALLGGVFLAVVAVLAAPYVLEWIGSPSKPQVSVVKPPAPPATPPVGAPPPPIPSPQPPAPPSGRPAPATPAAPPTPVSPPTVAEQPAQPAPKPAAPAAPSTSAPTPPVTEKPAEPAPKPAAAAKSRGGYWVQVGAFGDAKNAARLAARLNDQDYPVERATVTRGSGGGGNEVFVAGAKQRDVYDKVKTKGYQVDAVKGGALVRPALPLRDAVALSKELTDAGMDVKIRRVGGEKATVHLVRVGGFPDRREAEAARKKLAAKGIPGFVVKGAPR